MDDVLKLINVVQCFLGVPSLFDHSLFMAIHCRFIMQKSIIFLGHMFDSTAAIVVHISKLLTVFGS